MTDLATIIAALENAAGMDRELDLEIGLAFGGWSYVDMPPHGNMIFVPDEKSYYVDHPGSMYPSYTETVDTALAFMRAQLPGWMVMNLSEWEAEPLRTRGPWQCDLKKIGSGFSERRFFGKCNSAKEPQIAILLATLRAKQAEMMQ
jgi:hypothetical protein